MANNTRLALIFVGGFLFFADRILKTLSTSLSGNDWLLCRFFGWVPSTNTGIAFGIQLPQILVISLSILFIILLLEYFRRTDDNFLRFGIFFILLGAISNLFDRIIYGKTFDYFLLYTSLFNLADVLIIIGAVMCILNTASKKTEK